MLKQALGSNDQFLAGIKNAPKPINTTSQPQLAPSGEPIVCQALIMFDYAAQQPDELVNASSVQWAKCNRDEYYVLRFLWNL